MSIGRSSTIDGGISPNAVFERNGKIVWTQQLVCRISRYGDADDIVWALPVLQRTGYRIGLPCGDVNCVRPCCDHQCHRAGAPIGEIHVAVDTVAGFLAGRIAPPVLLGIDHGGGIQVIDAKIAIIENIRTLNG